MPCGCRGRDCDHNRAHGALLQVLRPVLRIIRNTIDNHSHLTLDI
jgi:hypothetical protein